MSNPNRSIDKTHLSADTAEHRQIIHRDLIAHCLRWSHVAKYLHQNQRYKDSHILDIGCGREQPLAKMLYSNRLVPSNGSYTGVDYNKLTLEPMLEAAAKRFPIILVGEKAFPDCELAREKYDVITCFEVLEHVQPLGSYRIIEGIEKLLSDDGVAFVSTPNYDDKTGAAANHINELKYHTTEALIRRAGLEIDAHFGTFASIKDYKDSVEEEGLQDLFNRLRAYYDSNYLATIFAPLYPRHSRNVLWRLKKSTSKDMFLPKFKELPQPLSSSNEWQPLFDYVGE